MGCFMATLALVYELSRFAILPVIFSPISDGRYHPYTSYRPVGFSIMEHYDCKPSSFWFGPIKPAAMQMMNR